MLPLQTALKTSKFNFIDIDSRKPQFYAGPTFENLNCQQSESKISYSPVRREFTPTNSTSASKLTDSHLSKSRTKHQMKKSERPFYDTSKLTVKK